MASLFDEIPEALSSPAFKAFCDTLYGHSLRLDDALIEEDVDALTAYAGRARGGRILDCGCGSGDLLRHLCRRVGAEGTGIDPSPACFAAHQAEKADIDALEGVAVSEEPGELEDRPGSLFEKAMAKAKEPSGLFVRANAIAGSQAGDLPAGGPIAADGRPFPDRGPGGPGEDGPEIAREGRLSFIRTSVQECRGVEGSFQLILAVDSLAECGDIAAALDRLIGFLAPDGVLLIAHTERQSQGDPRLAFSSTRVAGALKLRGLEIRGHDLTKSERLHWKLARRLLDGLGEECATEGKPGIRDRVAELCRAGTETVESDGFRRYWYRVLAPGRSAG